MSALARCCGVVLFAVSVVRCVFGDDSALRYTLSSPNGELQVKFQLDHRSRGTFVVSQGAVQLLNGMLGLVFADSGVLAENLSIVGTHRQSCDATYAIPIGKASSARDRHRQLTVSLQERREPLRKIDIQLRVFDDGVAVRYLIPQQPNVGKFVLTDELTRLTFGNNPVARFLPLSGYRTSYENYYETLPVSQISSELLIGLPMLLEGPIDVKTRWLALTEASLTNYAGMYVSTVDGAPGTFAVKLSPLPDREDEAKVVGAAPFATPWRVVILADDPGRLIESNIIFHLNEASKLPDASWIRPGTTTFPWWNHYVIQDVDFEPGVNTATMKYYIDFCAEQGISYHSLDGLDVAWYGGPIEPDGPTDVTTAGPAIDMPELLGYAREKGVRLRLWLHWKALKPQLDEAFATYERWGIEGVMIDFMDRDDQEMVNWYHEVAEKAAQHHLTVTWHGAYKPTGMERTWPNVLSYEGVLNQEYNKWSSKGTPPDHNLNVAFIRMLAGPLDYHQGGMRNVLPDQFHAQDLAPLVQGTRGHQLAMYIVYQNHLPMLVDYPSAYRDQSGLEFLMRAPANWDETRVLHAEIGKCLVIARRRGTDWYLGGMTSDKSRKLDLPLQFIGTGAFTAVRYLDDEVHGPTVVSRHEESVSRTDSLPIVMPAAGGFVAHIRKNAQ